MNDPGSNDNPRPSSTADSVRQSTYRQYVQTHGINASPKKAAANPGNRSVSKDRLVKGDKEVGVACNWCFIAALLINLTICVIFGAVWDMRVAGPGWVADPTRFLQYYGLNVGLGLGCGLGYGLMFVIHSLRSLRGPPPNYTYTKIAAFGTFSISAILIGFGISMMVVTDYSDSGTITQNSIQQTYNIGNTYADFYSLTLGNPLDTFSDILPDTNSSSLLFSEASIRDDWVAIFYGDSSSTVDQTSVYCTDQTVQDKFHDSWGDGCPSVDIAALTDAFYSCRPYAVLCSLNTLRGLFSNQLYAGATWLILGLFGLGTVIFAMAFVSYNKKEDPEMPKGEDTIIEEEPINKDLEQARPPVVRKSPGETQTVPGRGSAAIEGYGVRDGQAVDDEF